MFIERYVRSTKKRLLVELKAAVKGTEERIAIKSKLANLRLMARMQREYMEDVREQYDINRTRESLLIEYFKRRWQKIDEKYPMGVLNASDMQPEYSGEYHPHNHLVSIVYS